MSVVPAPAPPSTTPTAGVRVIKVTDERDGLLLNRGYSYYPQAWIDADGTVYVFCGHEDGVPRFFAVDLATGSVTRMDVRLPYGGTSEGWYWDREGRIYLLDGPRLRRVHPFSSGDEIVFDISAAHLGCDLWQAHSSDDGQTHSATVRRIVETGSYPKIGTIVDGNSLRQYIEAVGELDESQLTSDGGRVIIKETIDGLLINRIVNEFGERRVTNAEGAVGHSDAGSNILVGEWSPQHSEAEGQCVIWDLVAMTRRELFKTDNMGHVSIRNGLCLLSDSHSLSLVPLYDYSDSSPQRIIDHGMVNPYPPDDPRSYDFQVFASLDHTASVVTYMSNVAGRMDLYLLVLKGN